MADQHSRKLKIITFTIGSIAFECQLTSWKLNNNTPDGEKLFTYCPNGETREEGDDDYSLELKFLSDWRLDGISDFLVTHDKEIAAFVLDHLPDIVGEHVRWSGDLYVKAPPVGGDIRTTERTEITLQCIGKPAYSRP